MSQTKQRELPQKWWTAEDVAVVTGANKGIGFEIARMLVDAGVTTVLTARNDELGKQALQKIKEANKAGSGAVEFHALDISNPASVEAFAAWSKDSHGGLTMLINNAGIAFKGNTFGADEARQTLDVNFVGTAAVCRALQPLLRPNARIVNVSSSSGSSALRNCSPALQQRFLNARSYDEIAALADEFVAGIKAGTHKQDGWPSSMYGVSKLAESMYTRVLADELKEKGVMVNALNPGYCSTDMSSWGGTQTAANGADTPVWLALRPQEEFVTGRFWEDRKERAW